MINIGAITTSRSDFGILSEILIRINSLKKYNLNLFVCGSHLNKNYGNTSKEIKKYIATKIINCKNIIFKNNEIDTPQSSRKLFVEFLKKIKNKNINYLIMLGDRYELLPIANVCLLLGIKIIHIHGGEVTKGAIDNKIRNSISMIADYHFVATKKSKTNLIKFGIEKKKIFLLGAPGLENINTFLLKKEYLEKKFNFRFYKKNIILSFHSETLRLNQTIKNLNILCRSISFFKNVRFIVTSPSADSKSIYIKKKLLELNRKNKNLIYFDSLGHREYLSFLKICKIIIGNSSSGIIEAPSLGTYTINVGIRQQGRERAKSVYDVEFNEKQIKSKINKLLKLKKKNYKNPYFQYLKPSNVFIKKLNKIIYV